MYQLVLLFIVFLIIILYMSNNEYEHFNANEILLARKLKLFTDLVTNKLVDVTFSQVILPCVRTTQYKVYDEIVGCITSYKNYYENVLKEPILELYDDLKGKEYYNDYPFDPAFNIDVWAYDVADDTPPVSEHIFIAALITAYIKALKDTLRQIKININRPENLIMVSDAIMSERDVFIFTFKPIFSNYLIEAITDAMTQIYTVKRQNVGKGNNS